MPQMFQRGNRWVSKEEAIAMDEADKKMTAEAVALQEKVDADKVGDVDIDPSKEDSVDGKVEETSDPDEAEKVEETLSAPADVTPPVDEKTDEVAAGEAGTQ